MKRTDIKTLIEAMRIISEGIQSEDGVANAAIAEAADRLQEQNDYIEKLEIELDAATERIKLLENGLIKMALNKLNPPGGFQYEQKQQNN